MNLVEALLAADNEQLLNSRKEEYEVKRLSNILGQPFVLTLKAIPSKRYTEIQTAATIFKKKKQDVDLHKLQILTLTAGIESPSLNDAELLKKFGVITPAELLEKLLLAGEITNIADAISKLSGYDSIEDDAEEVKN